MSVMSAQSYATQDLPCFDCRRRKVKCSKTQPCSNCQRFGVECTYEDSDRLTSRKVPQSKDPLTRRVAELEELVRNLSRKPQHGSPMDTMAANIWQNAANTGTAASSVGRLVSDGNNSRYLQQSFWAAMYEEVRDLKFILQREPRSQGDMFFLNNTHNPNGQSVVHPSISESDFLLKCFKEKVDPFVKILHKPTLQLELNHFRRGILPDPTGFQCCLFAVYALALLPVCSMVIEHRFQESKRALLSRYRSYIEQGLSQLGLTTTLSISTLQAFLLYVTLLFWTGEMLHASTLLSVAIAMAKRMGLNHDGTHFSLSPWQIELRRRLWHHTVLLDAWCVENHGVQPLIQPTDYDTSLPLNQDDSAWDTSDFSSQQPQVQNHFTDATIALIHYEIGALTRFVLDHPYKLPVTIRRYLELNNELLGQARDRMEILYMRNLDPENNIVHRLARDLFEHAFRRLRLMQLQTLVNAKSITEEAQRASLEARMYRLAVEYCKTTQSLITFYTPYNFDWTIIRAFSWHSVATMLSMVLRHEALSNTPEARAARQRIEHLFQNRPSIDYLAGNDNLWEPLRMLRAELAVRQALPVRTSQSGIGAQGEMIQSPPTGLGAEGNSLVSMTSTYIDPAFFATAGREEGDGPASDQWAVFDAYM